MFRLNTTSIIFAGVNGLVLLCIFFVPNNLRPILVLFEAILLLTPLIFSNYKHAIRRQIIMFFLVVLTSELILFSQLRTIRKYFPSPTISQDKIIGYSQYNQYPIQFDYVFFALLCILPILIALVFWGFINKKK